DRAAPWQPGAQAATALSRLAGLARDAALDLREPLDDLTQDLFAPPGRNAAAPWAVSTNAPVWPPPGGPGGGGGGAPQAPAAPAGGGGGGGGGAAGGPQAQAGLPGTAAPAKAAAPSSGAAATRGASPAASPATGRAAPAAQPSAAVQLGQQP